VPAIVRWPAKVKAGQVSEQVAISMDWLPTLLAAAGGAPDPQYPTDGENLLPILPGKHPTTSARCCGATRPMPSARSAPATGNT
jgi:arylsulfatase A-like enzyme